MCTMYTVCVPHVSQTCILLLKYNNLYVNVHVPSSVMYEEHIMHVRTCQCTIYVTCVTHI